MLTTEFIQLRFVHFFTTMIRKHICVPFLCVLLLLNLKISFHKSSRAFINLEIALIVNVIFGIDCPETVREWYQQKRNQNGLNRLPVQPQKKMKKMIPFFTLQILTIFPLFFFGCCCCCVHLVVIFLALHSILPLLVNKHSS